MSINNNLNYISNFSKKVFNFLSLKIGTISIIVVCVLGVVAYNFFTKPQVIEDITTVKIGQLRQTVDVTGAVQPSREAKLSFQTIGAVSNVDVKIGDKVYQGDILASLQSGDAKANLLQAEAQLDSANATLGQLMQGSRKEEVAIKQQAVDNAKSSLEQSYRSLPDTIRNVDSTTADVLKNKLNTLFVSNQGHYNLFFSSCDQNLQSSIEIERLKLEKILLDFQNKASVVSAISSTEYIDGVFENSYETMIETNNLISLISSLLLLQCSTSNASLDDIRSTLSLVRATMNTLFLDITTKRSALISAKNLLAQAARDLDLIKAGTDPYKLKSQAAAVSQAEAQVASAKSGLQKTVIMAPFSGVISDVGITEGETVTSGKSVISILAVDSFEIEAKVPEIDIVKIKVGTQVEVTLDAYGRDIIFPAIVTRVNPTATTEGGVPVYKTVITFLGNDLRIKSGMTANIHIVTQNKTQTVTLESRFVEFRDETHGIVILRKNKIDTNREVTLGLRGQNGLIEVISGLVPGDEVVAPSTGVRTAQKQTN